MPDEHRILPRPPARAAPLLIVVALVLGSAAARGAPPEPVQAWPARPVRVVVGFGAGGVADVLGRYISEKLAKYNGQPFVIDNRPGAAGNIGAGIVAKAVPDGYQLLYTPGSVLTMNPSLYSNTPFGADSFAPIALLAEMPVLLVVHARHPAKTVGELVAAAKREPGKTLFSSPGAGSSLHLSIELFQRTAGVTIQHVPYKSGGEQVTAVLAGHATGMFVNPLIVMSHLKAGTMRALVVAGPARLPQLPEVPASAEVGLGAFDITSWFGMAAPAKTPPALVRKLGTQITAALHEPDVQQRLIDLGARPGEITTEAFAAFIKSDRAKWDGIIRAANIRLE